MVENKQNRRTSTIIWNINELFFIATYYKIEKIPKFSVSYFWAMEKFL